MNHRIPKEDLVLDTPLEEMSLYRWGSQTAKDYFCPTCGILPFRRPGDPSPTEIREGIEPFDGWAVNVRCLAGVNIDTIPKKYIAGSALELSDS